MTHRPQAERSAPEFRADAAFEFLQPDSIKLLYRGAAVWTAVNALVVLQGNGSDLPLPHHELPLGVAVGPEQPGRGAIKEDNHLLTGLEGNGTLDAHLQSVLSSPGFADHNLRLPSDLCFAFDRVNRGETVVCPKELSGRIPSGVMAHHPSVKNYHGFSSHLLKGNGRYNGRVANSHSKESAQDLDAPTDSRPH
jgi:hypothetical protein